MSSSSVEVSYAVVRNKTLKRTKRNVIRRFNVNLVKVLTSLKKLTYVCVTVMILLFISSTMLVSADVPTVQNVKATKEGEDTVLDIEIRHSSPSSTHYIDIIEIEINERLDRVTDLEPQTSTTFTYKYSIGTVKYETIRLRAHCTLHGWSSWTKLGEELPETPFIETPLGIASVIGGIIVVVAVLFIVLRKSGKI